MLNEALRLMRIFHDLSQAELAEKIGISKSWLSEIEAGKRTPTLELLIHYSELFNVPLATIMFFGESTNKNTRSEQLRAFISAKILGILNFVAEHSGYSYVED